MTLPGNVPGSTVNPQRGEVWHVRLEPTEGAEQGKARPVIVLGVAGVGRAGIHVCVPLMGFQLSHAGRFWLVPVDASEQNGLGKLSTADATQVRALDVLRFEHRIGTLEAEHVQAVADTLAVCVGAAPPTSST